MRHRLAGGFAVALPPDEAFRLFTARGEEDWAPGWRPVFPEPVEDDSAPGTVFQTEAHGQTTTWVVVACEAGRSISYARIAGAVGGAAAPGAAAANAGTVTVTLEPTDAGTVVEVTYDLTALSSTGADALAKFAAGYPEFMRSWQAAIESWLARR